MGFRFGSTTTATDRPLGLGGRIGLTLFFAVFLAMGTVFFVLILRGIWRAHQSHSWPAVPCTVVDSGVTETDEGYRFTVRYRYQYAGRDHESATYQDGYAGNDQFRKAERLANQFPVGAQTTCRVNPNQPDEAVLVLRGRGGMFVLLFPLIFVAIGGGGIWFAWRKPSPAPGAGAPLSSTPSPGNGTILAIIFFGIFVVVGGLLTYFFTVRPYLRVQTARTWPATPCVVVASRVQSHAGDDSTTYSVDILYRYQVAGREYRSNRYNFLGGSSSGYDSKAAIVAQHPPGKRTTCYVNPNDPTDAVLVRHFTTGMWLGLLPLVFLAAGLFGVVHFARGGARPQPVVPAAGPAGPVTLRPQTSPVAKLIGTIFAAAFWNGIVAVFVTQAVRGWQRGHPDYFLTLFLVPFVLVGLALLGGIGYFLLALFNPRLRLTLSARSIPVGGAAELRWEMSGRARALRRLEIVLEGREEATYTRGTTSVTDKEVFTTIPLLDTGNPWDMQTGRAQLLLPPDAMHTFRATHNKILWHLRVRGDIPCWPDLKEEYEVTILPR